MTDATATPATAPAGWYNDGSGRQRWWDGNQWGQYAPQQTVTLASPGIAYLCWLLSLVMICGVQHFYLGKVGRGIGYLLTFGWLGVGTIIDLFTLPAQTRQVNAQRAASLIR